MNIVRSSSLGSNSAAGLVLVGLSKIFLKPDFNEKTLFLVPVQQ